MPEVIPVEAYADLVRDDTLGLQEADAIASAFDTTTGTDVDVLHLPLPIAEEKVLEPQDGSDQVFIVELVTDRETGAAYYARQGRRGCWVPKSATRIYVEAEGADILVPEAASEMEGSA